MLHRWVLFCLFCILVRTSSGEAIPLASCNGLPIVQVEMAGMKFFFLLDTAANSTLNVKSFAFGQAQNISVTSWSGTLETKGQRVTINDLLIGQHHLRNLTLPAVDISAIGQVCGRPIDGIMGIDVLRRLGAVVDLNARVVQLAMDSESAEPAVKELQERLVSCGDAFNRGDEDAFSDCFDPAVVVLTRAGDFYGRPAWMEFYRQKYFHQRPPAHLSIKPRVYHLVGEAIRVEYELRATLGPRTIMSGGTALCRKLDGSWRIIDVNSLPPYGNGQPK